VALGEVAGLSDRIAAVESMAARLEALAPDEIRQLLGEVADAQQAATALRRTVVKATMKLPAGQRPTVADIGTVLGRTRDAVYKLAERP
jgi:hypothetical protein